VRQTERSRGEENEGRLVRVGERGASCKGGGRRQDLWQPSMIPFFFSVRACPVCLPHHKLLGSQSLVTSPHMSTWSHWPAASQLPRGAFGTSGQRHPNSAGRPHTADALAPPRAASPPQTKRAREEWWSRCARPSCLPTNQDDASAASSRRTHGIKGSGFRVEG
jgi:hypothetical protein